MNIIGEQVAVITKCMIGNEPDKNELKYFSKIVNKVVTIVYQFHNGLYLTDFFMPEFINEKNDYVHYGFIVIDHYMFTRLME